MQTEEFDEVLTHARLALELNPQSIKAHFRRAMAYYHQDEFDLAAKFKWHFTFNSSASFLKNSTFLNPDNFFSRISKILDYLWTTSARRSREKCNRTGGGLGDNART